MTTHTAYNSSVEMSVITEKSHKNLRTGSSKTIYFENMPYVPIMMLITDTMKRLPLPF